MISWKESQHDSVGSVWKKKISVITKSDVRKWIVSISLNWCCVSMIIIRKKYHIEIKYKKKKKRSATNKNNIELNWNWNWHTYVSSSVNVVQRIFFFFVDFVCFQQRVTNKELFYSFVCHTYSVLFSLLFFCCRSFVGLVLITLIEYCVCARVR